MKSKDYFGDQIEKHFYDVLSQGHLTEFVSHFNYIKVTAVPRPVAQIGPIDAAHCGGSVGPGTFGASISCNGTAGVLSAGHISALIGNSPVHAYTSNGAYVGMVSQRMCYEYDQYGQRVTPTMEVPDVCVVDTSDTFSSTGLSAGIAQIRDVVTSYGAVTSGLSSQLETIGAPFAGPDPSFGVWGETMMTMHAISTGGDSGAVVCNADGHVVGQVVGGYPGVYSLIQDIDYLLQATGAVLR
ncbi:hypothetical protein H7K45_24945 [Mycobacterium yunnanensis]|uniref:Trypsin n=1 Tax=Mycobacterium yunnanensis TaxID=368477 RepID=A0A9X2YQL1_9MYCO|nr:hypothetical protein [Mycobacterium yunnanensis]MCV7423807.1 hypothetical protein [Mycobacterium yunnanensis]